MKVLFTFVLFAAAVRAHLPIPLHRLNTIPGPPLPPFSPQSPSPFSTFPWPFSPLTYPGILSEPATKCTALSASIAQKNSNVTVNFAEFVAAGTNISLTQDYNMSTCDRPSQVTGVDICRVAMSVATSDRSGITLEAWLPSNWTGRFLGTGNGGISGCIQYEDIAYGANLGFATVGGNAGHNGSSGAAFLHNDDIIHDYVDRGMHTGVVVGKQVTKLFYGSDYTYSYYLGCSTGGRQGFKAVQEYPDDFNGLVVGAPAVDFINLNSWSGTFYQILGNSSSDTFVSPALWLTIHTEILNQCDAMDGAVDSVIEDPLMCDFRPESLLCSSSTNDTSTCLTSKQAAAVRLVYSPYYGSDGKLIYPRMQPGSEFVARFVYYAGIPFDYTVDWFKYVVYNDTNWDPATDFNLSAVAKSQAQNPFNVQTWEGDLSSFKATGGKVLHWHGGADFIISSDNSPRYYDHVSTTMGLPSSDLDDFYRFFRVSGTGHCKTGDGAHQIGQAASEVSELNPQNNVLLRIVDWVENGGAPDTVTGTKYVNDDPTQGVAFTRNHCRYPLRNTYVGPGNSTLASSWKCVV